ncbi:hypothetical protein NA57DRAFT_77222 [Rhizodiscina lignyota]|uniref:Uncharacterized protein n=1 Tax=Rhizodiscina lignyota TaxID=1504668 RepID=A0A9P4M746_9PEZI|nr:hypothetical protein NA57DRAFT_77222 [Rhizodiscina lignyota]
MCQFRICINLCGHYTFTIATPCRRFSTASEVISGPEFPQPRFNRVRDPVTGLITYPKTTLHNQNVNGIEPCRRPTSPSDETITRVFLVPFRCEGSRLNECARREAEWAWRESGPLAAKELQRQNDQLYDYGTQAIAQLRETLEKLGMKEQDLEECLNGKTHLDQVKQHVSTAITKGEESEISELTLTKVLLNYDKISIPLYGVLQSIHRLKGYGGLINQFELEWAAADALKSSVPENRLPMEREFNDLAATAITVLFKGKKCLVELQRVLQTFRHRAEALAPAPGSWDQIFEHCLSIGNGKTPGHTAFDPTIRRPERGQSPPNPESMEKKDEEVTSPGLTKGEFEYLAVNNILGNGPLQAELITNDNQSKVGRKRASTLNPSAMEFVLGAFQDLNVNETEEHRRIDSVVDAKVSVQGEYDEDCPICGDFCFCKNLLH